jgi:hypothetical protein
MVDGVAEEPPGVVAGREPCAAVRPRGRLGLAPIAVLDDQQLGDVIHQGLGLPRVDGGQLIALHEAWRPADPAVGLVGVGVDAVGDALLAVAEQLDALFVPVGRDEIDGDLGERPIGLERDRSFRRTPDAHQHRAEVAESVLHQALDGGGRLVVEDVDIEHGREAGQEAGVGGAGPLFAPALDVGAGGDEVRPVVQHGSFAGERDRREPSLKQ